MQYGYPILSLLCIKDIKSLFFRVFWLEERYFFLKESFPRVKSRFLHSPTRSELTSSKTVITTTSPPFTTIDSKWLQINGSWYESYVELRHTLFVVPEVKRLLFWLWVSSIYRIRVYLFTICRLSFKPGLKETEVVARGVWHGTTSRYLLQISVRKVYVPVNCFYTLNLMTYYLYSDRML